MLLVLETIKKPWHPINGMQYYVVKMLKKPKLAWTGGGNLRKNVVGAIMKRRRPHLFDRLYHRSIMCMHFHEENRVLLQSSVCVGVVLLPTTFTPSNRDVICGRAKKNYYHAGNQQLRQLVAANVRRYLVAKTKVDKKSVVLSIVDEVRQGSPQGGFVRQDPRTGGWFVVDDATAREKVGATVRSMIRKAGGEAALLSQLSQLDNRDLPDDSPPSGGEPFMSWMPPNVAAHALRQTDEESSLSPDMDFNATASSTNDMRNNSAWKSTGLDFTETELNWLTETTGTPPESKDASKSEFDQRKLPGIRYQTSQNKVDRASDTCKEEQARMTETTETKIECKQPSETGLDPRKPTAVRSDSVKHKIDAGKQTLSDASDDD